MNIRTLAGVLCLSGLGMAAAAGPTGQSLQRESQPEDSAYEIVRMSKPDGTVVEMRVPRHRSLSAARPVVRTGSVRRLPGTAMAGEEPEVTPRIGGRRAATIGQRAAMPRASSEGPVRPARADAGRVVTQRTNSGARISHPYTGSRQITSDVVDLMRPAGTPRRGAVSQTPVVASDNASEWRTGLGWVPNNEDDDTGRYLSEDDAFAELEPGDGWDGPTDDPGPIGNDSMPGWDAKAIARWDVVPYQTFDEPFHIGVVAFHMNGIDRVDFSVDGGPWVSVEEMQLNPRTDVWEYTAVLRPEFFAEDGLVEVRAIVWPEGAGVPRVLGGELDRSVLALGEHSLYLHCNAQNTLPAAAVYVSMDGSDSTGTGTPLSPFRSIAKAAKVLELTSDTGLADGGTIYLEAGDYSWGPSERDFDGNYIGRPLQANAFLTIASAPGTPMGDVRIATSESGGLKGTLIHATGLVWKASVANAVPSDTDPLLWLNNCRFEGSGPTDNIPWAPSTSWPGGVFVTDSTVRDARYGFNSIVLARNVDIADTGDDAFANPGSIINCRVTNIEIPDGSGFHSDVIQFHATGDDSIRNRLVYGLTALDCDAQGWHIGYTGHAPSNEWQDLAFVNTLIEASDTQQWIPSANHVLWWNMTTPGGTVYIRNNPDSGGGSGEVCRIRNFSMRNCVFNAFSLRTEDIAPSLENQNWADNNHFIDTEQHGAVMAGSNATSGGSLASLFVAYPMNDFRPSDQGALSARSWSPPVPTDAAGHVLELPAAIGAFQPPASPN